MIPRIRIADPKHNEEASAFARGPRERQLRILVDLDSIPADDIAKSSKKPRDDTVSGGRLGDLSVRLRSL